MSKVVELLRDKACYYLDHTCETIDKSLIHVPSPDTIDKIWIDSDRSIRVLNSLQTLLGHGRLANTGYVSILPVDHDEVLNNLIKRRSNKFFCDSFRFLRFRGWEKLASV